MITLDGVEYTFNGYGEYHILQVAGPEFKLQGRMQPLINEDGNATRATVYKAFTMKENNSDVVQVTLACLEAIYQTRRQCSIRISNTEKSAEITTRSRAFWIKSDYI